jgi:presenilin-like A22 family membrane protease
MPLEGRSCHKQTRVIALDDKFEARLVHLTPILASLLFGVSCAFLVLTSPIEVYEITPFPEDVFGSLGNAFYFVIIVGVGASLIYLLLKRRKRKLITLITGFALTTAVFMLSIIYLSAAFSRFAIPNTEALVLVLSLLITALADFAIFRTSRRACDLTVLFLGGALGTFLGVSIPTLSAILILVFLAVYDAFAVYHGPVGKIAHSGLEQLRGLSFSFKDIQMGLGDLTFYSMLTSRVLFESGPYFCFASTAGVLIGVFLAFKMLEKKGMFPGLPIPMALGLMPLIVSVFL